MVALIKNLVYSSDKSQTTNRATSLSSDMSHALGNPSDIENGIN